MTDTATGRDIFVATTLSAADIGARFGKAFHVPQDGLVVDDGTHHEQLAAWSQPRCIVIYPLAPDGDFNFKLAIDLDIPIATDRFRALARQQHLTIAWAVDESSLLDDYYVAFPSGKLSVHAIHFRESGDDYACVLLPETGPLHDTGGEHPSL